MGLNPTDPTVYLFIEAKNKIKYGIKIFTIIFFLI